MRGHDEEGQIAHHTMKGIWPNRALNTEDTHVYRSQSIDSEPCTEGEDIPDDKPTPNPRVPDGETIQNRRYKKQQSLEHSSPSLLKVGVPPSYILFSRIPQTDYLIPVSISKSMVLVLDAVIITFFFSPGPMPAGDIWIKYVPGGRAIL